MISLGNSLVPRFVLVVVLSWPAPGGGASAQQSDTPNNAERVLVTGESPDLLSPSVEEAKARLQTVPAATSVYDSNDYDLGRHDYLEDFLRYQPGLAISSTQGAEDTHVSSRGSGQNNDDIIGLAILVDGIPINQGDGEAFLHDIDLQSVKYAEVYRGADALRYGSVTLGGAIDLVSLTGQEDAPVSVGASFGSFGYYQQTLSTGLSHGPWDLFAAFSDHVQDGYQEHSQENYQKVTINLGYRPSDTMENRFYFFYGRLDQNNPAALDKDDLYADPRLTDPEAIQEQWDNRNDFKLLEETFRHFAQKKPEPTTAKPQHMLLDKGYDYDEVRAILQAHGLIAHIRSRGEETAAKKKQPGKKARRWVVERTHGWMNRFRSILTRWCKKEHNYLGMLYFVCGLISYRAAGLFG